MTRNSSRIFTLIVVAFLILVGTRASRLLRDAGVFTKIENHNLLGRCTSVANILGPEDMAVIPGTDHLIVSSDARDEHSERSGDLYLYDLGSLQTAPQHIQLLDRGAFHPHGLDVIQADGQTRVFVVNHRTPEETTIEVFGLRPDGTIVPMKTLRDPLFNNGNDLVAVSLDHFYLTTDFATPDGLKRKMEQYLRLPSGYISYYDGQKAHQVAANLFFANGITATDDHKHLFAVEMLGQKLHTYDIDAASGDLKEAGVLNLGFSPDNITLKGQEILFGVHPKILKLKAYSQHHGANDAQKSPSRVMRLADWSATQPDITELFMDDGGLIGGSSVALRVSPERVMVGSVFDDHFIDCRSR